MTKDPILTKGDNTNRQNSQASHQLQAQSDQAARDNAQQEVEIESFMGATRPPTGAYRFFGKPYVGSKDILEVKNMKF